ncbi:spermidine synthase [Aeromicrobium sp. CF4.19]|uniref:spermidine synthase n=1 Tax=Aeromicrobium sp. CF4.19 TaxID=3373082 RepID=UPI003EE6C425
MEIEIVADRDRPSGHVVRVGGADQSYVDLDDPTHLEFPYVRRIADVLDVLEVEGRLRVVHVGGAGLTLPRYLATTRPGTAQVVLEPDEALTDLVRERLPLPRRSGVKVRPQDGLTGLGQMPDDYADAVVVDAFVGARVPAELATVECLSELRRVLGPQGVLVMNVSDKAPFAWTARLVAAAAKALGEVALSAEPATLKGRRGGNVVLAASAGRVPWQELERRAARTVFPYRVVPPTDVRRRFAGAVPFTVDDTEPSPAPPDGATYFS